MSAVQKAWYKNMPATYYYSNCASVQTLANWASLGESLQTLSELVYSKFENTNYFHDSPSTIYILLWSGVALHLHFIGARFHSPYTSGKTRLRILAQRRKADFPSIRLPSCRRRPHRRSSTGLGHNFERFSNAIGRFTGEELRDFYPTRVYSTGCRSSLERDRSSIDRSFILPSSFDKISVGGGNSLFSATSGTYALASYSYTCPVLRLPLWGIKNVTLC